MTLRVFIILGLSLFLNSSHSQNIFSQNSIKIENKSNFTIKAVIVYCSTTTFLGVQSTTCPKELFTLYPHKKFKTPFLTTDEEKNDTLNFLNFMPSGTPLPPNPIQILLLGPGESKDLSLTPASKKSWYQDFYTIGEWVYMTAVANDDSCEKNLSRSSNLVSYSGVWADKTAEENGGWLSPSRSDNPSHIILSHSNSQNPCSLLLIGK